MLGDCTNILLEKLSNAPYFYKIKYMLKLGQLKIHLRFKMYYCIILVLCMKYESFTFNSKI